MTSVVAVVGTIPGAGTTTVVSALGAALGEQRKRVALVDATPEGSRIADAISITGGGDLTDALRRGTSLGDVQGTGPHDLTAFPADPDASWGSIRPDAVVTLYEQLRERFSFTLVDCGSSLSPASSAWLGHADEVVIVTDPDVAGTVPETAALAGAFSVPVRGVLANRVPPNGVDDALEALEATDQQVLGAFPEDPTVGAAEIDGISVLRAEPDSQIATCAWDLGRRFRTGEHGSPVVPFRVGQPSNTAATDESTDESAPATDDGVEPDPSDADPSVQAEDRADDPDDSDEESTGGATSDPPEPAPAPPATTASSTTDAKAASSDPDGADDNGAGTATDDPFTAVDLQPPKESESDASPADGHATEASDDGVDSTRDESLDGLLGDVREHVGDADDADQESPADAGADAPDTTVADEAELSDEEIEAVFEETSERVQKRRKPEPEDDGEAE